MADGLLVLDVHGVIFTNPLVPFLAEAAERSGGDGAHAVAMWNERLRRPFWLGRLEVNDLWRTVAPGADGPALTAELEQRYTEGPFFRWIERTDAPIWLLSNHRTDWLEARLERFGLARRFERVYVSDAIGHVKPDAAAFRFAQRQAGDRPVTYVDDKPGNVAVASGVFARALTVGEALEAL
ncbi:MAG: HAD family hydrolase [Candidatus Limnocylindrales bacterium]